MENLVKVSNDELAKQYDRMLDNLNCYYKKGFFKWVQAENPHIARRLVILDEKINEVWEMCTQGKASLTMFKAGLKLYEQTVRKALRDYE